MKTTFPNSLRHSKKTYFVVGLQLYGLEILQFSQIPQFYNRVIRSRCQVVSNISISKTCASGIVAQHLPIFREGNSRNLSCMAREVGNVATLLQVPDFHNATRIKTTAPAHSSIHPSLPPYLSDVPVPKIKPSGWNCAHVKAGQNTAKLRHKLNKIASSHL